MAPFRRCLYHWPVALILAIPLLGITASMIAVGQAVSQPPQMVSGDYQRLGKTIVDSWQAERQAAALKLHARLEWNGDSIALQLQPGQAMQLPSRVRLRLAHPVDASNDVIIWLERRNGADYQATLARPDFQGHLTLEPLQAQWRLHGRLQDEHTAVLGAGVQSE